MNAGAGVAVPMLNVLDVHAGYQAGVDILQGISLSVRPKSITAVIGPNGAGKSTLLKAIFGFVRPHRGDVYFAGQSIGQLQPYRIKALGIGYITQELNTFPQLTIEENLMMGAWSFRRDKPRLARQLAKMYDIFGILGTRRRHSAGSLSGGQARMLSVARALIAEPALVLIDEPTAGLAPSIVAEVYALLQAARAEAGTAMLLVDQDVEHAVALADDVYMVNLGRIKASGPAAQFTSQRVSELIQECLAG